MMNMRKETYWTKALTMLAALIFWMVAERGVAATVCVWQPAVGLPADTLVAAATDAAPAADSIVWVTLPDSTRRLWIWQADSTRHRPVFSPRSDFVLL